MTDIQTLKTIKLDLDRMYYQIQKFNNCYDKYIKSCKSDDYDDRVRRMTGYVEADLRFASIRQKHLIRMKNHERDESIKKIA